MTTKRSSVSQSIFKNIKSKLQCFIKLFFIVTICLSFFTNHTKAQTIPNTKNRFVQHLKVGLVTTHPFVIEKNHYYSGVAYDIWKNIASLNHFDCEYVDAGKNTDIAVEKLEKGDFDVLVGGVGIYSSRLSKGDYSLPFFRAEYVLAAKNSSRGFLYNLNSLLNNHSKISIFLVISSYLMFLTLFWLLERNNIPDIAQKKILQGLDYLFWQSSLQSRFSHPFFPHKTITKIICILWQTILYCLSFSLIAGFSSSQIDKMQNNKKMFLEPSDVGNKPIALFGSENSLKVAKVNHLNIVKKTSSPQEAISLLDSDEVEGVFMLYGTINAYINENDRKDLYISPIKYPDLQLGFMVNHKKADLIPDINWALLKLGENGEKSKICEYYKKDIRYINCFWY